MKEREEILEIAKNKLELEITKKLHENNFVKKLYDSTSVTGAISKERLSNNEYKFGKKVNVNWLSINTDGLPDRTIKLHHVTWSTPLNIKLSPQRQIRNDTFQYVSGKAGDIVFSWEYNPDGELKIYFEEYTLQDKVELKRYN